MEVVSIRELSQKAGPQAAPFAVHAQLDALTRKEARSGNPFYELKFADAEDTLILRAWDETPVFKDCEAEKVKVRGFFQLEGEWYRNADRGSIDPKSWTLRPLTDEEISAMIHSDGPLQQQQSVDYQFITDTTAAISDPRLRALSQKFLDRFGERFRRTAGARGYHHARRGGLVEHVAQMMRAAVKVCEAYPLLNRDLLVTGVLFHDVGKLWENAYPAQGFNMPFTEVSELISHIPMGMEIVNRLWRELQDDPVAADWLTLQPASESVRLHLLHLVASHHGELEFGAPVVPKTPEASALHYIDNLDAKMEMFFKGYETATEIGKNVYQRVRPLPGNLVRPLDKFQGVGESPAPAPEAPPAEPAPEPVAPEPAPVPNDPEPMVARESAPLPTNIAEMEDPF